MRKCYHEPWQAGKGVTVYHIRTPITGPQHRLVAIVDVAIYKMMAHG